MKPIPPVIASRKRSNLLFWIVSSLALLAMTTITPLVFAEDNLAAVLKKATVKEKAGDYEGAQSLYEGILFHHPEHRDALYGVARTEYWQGKYKESVTAYEKLLKIYPDESGAMVGIGKSYLAMGEDTKAQEYFRKAEKLDPKNEEVKTLSPAIEEPAYFEIEGGSIIEDVNYAANPQGEYQEIRYTREHRYGFGFHSSYWDRFGGTALNTGLFGNYYFTHNTRGDLFFYFAPRANIVPELKVGTNFGQTFWDTVTPGLGYQFEKYKQADIHTVTPSLKFQPWIWVALTGIYNLEFLEVGGGSFTNHSLVGELELIPATFLSIHGGAGRFQKDFEAGRTVPIFPYSATTLFSGFKAILGNTLLFHFDFAWEDRNNNENSYKYTFGLGYRF